MGPIQVTGESRVKHDCEHPLWYHSPHRIEGKLMMVCSAWIDAEDAGRCSCKFDGSPYEGQKADGSIPWKYFFDARAQAMRYADQQDKKIIEDLHSELNTLRVDLNTIKARLFSERIKALWVYFKLKTYSVVKWAFEKLSDKGESQLEFQRVEDILRVNWDKDEDYSKPALYRLNEGVMGTGHYLVWKDKEKQLIEGCNGVVPLAGSCIMDGSDQYWVEDCISQEAQTDAKGMTHFVLKVATSAEYGSGQD